MLTLIRRVTLLALAFAALPAHASSCTDAALAAVESGLHLTAENTQVFSAELQAGRSYVSLSLGNGMLVSSSNDGGNAYCYVKVTNIQGDRCDVAGGQDMAAACGLAGNGQDGYDLVKDPADPYEYY